jgi:hypothetical protein
MDELRLTGNCLKGSRPFLSFDAGFDSTPHLRLLREMFSQVFNVPRGHPKSQPFFDHVLGFYLVDGKIWVRHYQVGGGIASVNYESCYHCRACGVMLSRRRCVAFFGHCLLSDDNRGRLVGVWSVCP